MLRTRLLSGGVLAAATLGIVWLAPPLVVAFVFAAGVVIAAAEWGGLAGLNGTARLAYAVGVALLVAASGWLVSRGLSLVGIGWFAVLVWGLALAQLILYSRGQRAAWSLAVSLGGGALLLTASWLSLLAPLIQHGDAAYWLTALFVMVWGSDIGGYFAGRAFGQRPLAPSISPSKTWEGCLGGVLLAGIGVAVLIGLVTGLGGVSGPAPWHHLWMVPVVVAAAITGDLFESVLKRQAGAKDSGRIVAGHGGLLDRVDALLMAAPVFALLMASSA